MTIFGWDASHFDGPVSRDTLALAKSQGITFVTHKLGEGLTNSDGTDSTFLLNALNVGFELIGGYWFVHGTDDPVAEAQAAISHARANETWWLDFAGAFWQVDAENSSTGLPSPSWIKTFSDTLANETGLKVIVYASRGQYGNSLTGLGYPLWNAAYGLNPIGPFKSIYQGDNFMGWLPYSGQVPTLLQYSSRATIAGLTTCDANAFRGTLDQLKDILMADVETQDMWAAFAKFVQNGSGETAYHDGDGQINMVAYATKADVAAINAKLDTLIAQSANSGSGSSVPLDVTLTGTATPHPTNTP